MTTLEVYRDDGPLARALAPLGRAVAPSLPATLAVVPLLVAIAVKGAGASHGLIAAAVGWLILLGGASRGGALERDRFRWMVAPMLRAGEYTAILWISAAGCIDGPGAGFALLVALTFRHYDLVYRLRYQGRTPPAWVSALAGGWDGRVLVAWILLAANALPAGLYVLAAILGAVFVAESAASWRGFHAGDRPALYDEGEGEAE
ncbi:MAG: hypothetical protein JWM71_1081 [Solirubrobacteraceae bacterium]|nr:hypothetical protein [Solirubrobacteraceae bacterium]